MRTFDLDELANAMHQFNKWLIKREYQEIADFGCEWIESIQKMWVAGMDTYGALFGKFHGISGEIEFKRCWN